MKKKSGIFKSISLVLSFFSITLWATQPLVSVIIPVYSEQDDLRSCLQDIFFNQSIVHKLEINILAISSSENHKNIIAGFRGSQTAINYMPLNVDMSLGALLNVAIMHSKGTYSMVWQINDRYHRQALEQLTDVLEKNPSLDGLYASVYRTEQKVDHFDETVSAAATPASGFSPALLAQGELGSCVIWRTALHVKVGYFRQDFKVLAAWEFFNRAVRRGAVLEKYPAVLAAHYENPEELRSSVKFEEQHYIEQEYKLFWQGNEPVLPEKPMVVVIPSYNNVHRCKKNLDSVFAQKYQNYRIIYVDDASNDGNGEFVERYVKERGQEHRVTIIHNKEREGAAANKYKAALLCDNIEVYVDLDGDDEAAHEHVLAHLNRVYSDPNIWVTYGQFIYWPSGLPGWAAPLAPSIIENNTIRKENWSTTAMRTFYAGLFKRVRPEDLMLDGRFVMMASDLAFMFSVMEMGGKHSVFIPEVLYVYDFGGNHNDQVANRNKQMETGWRIRTKKPYQPIENYAQPRKKVYFTPGWTLDLFAKDSPIYNRDNCLERFCQMKERLEEGGYEVCQVKDGNCSNDDACALICFDVVGQSDINLLQKFPKEKRILFLWEPPSVFPHCYDRRLHESFSRVYTWADDLVDHQKYFKFFYPVLQPMIEDVIDFDKKQFCTLIAWNKHSNYPQELYSQRRATIEFFEKNHPNDFDLYGGGWDPGEFETYKGAITTKLDYLKHYKFCICYENLKECNGYVTEKIFDAMCAGCVPIYWGAPNIGKYVPKSCFIDRRDFANHEELYAYLKAITREQYEQYLKNIKDFLNSDAAKPYSIDNFVHLMNDLVTHVDANVSHQKEEVQKAPFYIVTGANAGYFEVLLNLIGSLHKTNYERTGQIAVFDLGLTDQQKEILKKIDKVELYAIEMTNPQLLTPLITTHWGKKVPGCYAWKPVIVKQALDMFDTILYIDAGTTVYRPLDDLFDHIKTKGYFLHDGSPWHVARMTTQYVRKKFDLDSPPRSWILKPETFGLEAGFMGLTRAVYDTFVKPMYEITKNDFAAFIDDGTCQGGFGNSRHDLTLFSIYALLNGMHIYHHFEHPKEDFYLETSQGKKPFHIACNPQDRTQNTHIYASRFDADLNYFKQFIRWKK